MESLGLLCQEVPEGPAASRVWSPLGKQLLVSSAGEWSSLPDRFTRERLGFWMREDFCAYAKRHAVSLIRDRQICALDSVVKTLPLLFYILKRVHFSVDAC